MSWLKSDKIVEPEQAAIHTPDKYAPQEVDKKKHYLVALLSLGVAFFFFYTLSIVTQDMVTLLNPKKVVFSNMMLQLWTASYRLTFMLLIAFALFVILDKQFNLTTTVQNDLSPPQRIWLSFAIIVSLCLLFVLLLSVKLPVEASAGR